MPIDLHIERLVVDGVAMTTAERGVFAESLTAELTRLLRDTTSAGRLPSGGAVPVAAAQVAELRTPFDARHAGTAVAKAVYSSLAVPAADSGREP